MSLFGSESEKRLRTTIGHFHDRIMKIDHPGCQVIDALGCLVFSQGQVRCAAHNLRLCVYIYLFKFIF